mgnify:CR=1 FL=1
MDLLLLKKYGPLILLLAFFLFKFIKTKKIKKMIPKLKERGVQIVDVRQANEFMRASNPSSINIPLNVFEKNIDQLSKEKPVLLCCASGTRSAMALRILKKHGFEVYNAGSWINTN